jgi:hypothetical protein
MLAFAVSAYADPAPLINEGFDYLNPITSLTNNGWLLVNQSTPIGSTGWTQGDASQFAAQTGGPVAGDAAYMSANFNSGVPDGSISNWLITPTFSTELAGTVSFWAKAAIQDPYFDKLRVGFSDGSTDTLDFSLSKAITVTGDWVQYSFSYAAGGVGSFGRFAIDYTGWANNANYVGIDTLTVTPVPEPSTWAMFGLGLVGLVAYSRRRAKANA